MRRWHPRRLVAAVWLAATASSCSLFSDLGGLASEVPSDAAAPSNDGGAESGTTKTPDGAASDSSTVVTPDADGGAGDAAAPNLHPNGTFENGCDGWGNYYAQLTPSTIAHSGKGSCRVCSATNNPDTFFTIDDGGASGPPVVGARYLATAWVRGGDTGTFPSFAVANLRTASFNPFASYDQAAGPNTALSTSWIQLSVILTITQAKGNLNVFVGAPKETATGCFLVDDVRLERLD